MKRVSVYLVLACVFMLNTASMCSTTDDNSTSSDPTPVINTMTQGTWRVTTFSEDDTDHTNDFSNYDFTFASSGVLTATNGSVQNTGVWSVTAEDSSSSLDFNIGFSSPATFAEITEDWQILERTSSKLRLQHTSGGDGSIDLLTFEKN